MNIYAIKLGKSEFLITHIIAESISEAIEKFSNDYQVSIERLYSKGLTVEKLV